MAKDKKTALPQVELTEEEKLALEQEVREELAAEARERMAEQFRTAARNRLLREQMFQEGKNVAGEEVETIHLELAPVQHFIKLDNRCYYHGKTYTVSRAVAQVLKEAQFRGWEQEAARLKEKPDVVFNKQKVLGKDGLRAM